MRELPGQSYGYDRRLGSRCNETRLVFLEGPGTTSKRTFGSSKISPGYAET